MGVKFQRSLRNSFLTVTVFAAASLPALSQPRYTGYSQKLAPFVPSPQRVVDRMLDMAAPKPNDVVFDLGCGDGRVLISAVQRFKARAVGVEVDERLVARATERIAQANLQNQIRIIKGDLMEADLSSADVVVIYLLTGSNEMLRPRLEKMLRPGTRVVSYSYRIPGWKPLRVDKTDEQHGHEIYLYEMPPTKQ